MGFTVFNDNIQSLIKDQILEYIKEIIFNINKKTHRKSSIKFNMSKKYKIFH